MRITVSQKGQIVIPAKLRKHFGIERGTKLEVRERKGRIELEPVPKAPILALRGKYRSGKSLTSTLIEERSRESRRENKR